MPVITPQSDVYLLKVPLEIDNENQLTFANATAQYNYFSSLPSVGFDDFTYIRKDGVLRVPDLIDNLYEYNYVMYRNEAYSDKWFYAYITGMEYMNDNVTDISIATDTFQTWQFQLNYKPTLIEREHVNDDTIGKHTLPEDLELGEYVCNGTVTQFGIPDTGNWGDYCLVIDVSMIENEGDGQTLSYSWISGHDTPSQYVNGIPSGLYHIILGYNSSIVISARDVINVYDVAGLGDAIQNIYIVPKTLVGEVEDGLTLSSADTTTSPARTASCGGLAMPKYSSGASTLGTFTYTRPSTINGYTPKNNKLFCAPFNYLNVSNNAGTTQPYRYEEFASGVSFTVEGALAPSGSIKASPNQYKSIASGENAFDFSINGAKLPMCAWVTDSYTNWLTQNGVNMQASAITTGFNTLAGMAGGLLLGGGVGLAGAMIAGGVGLLNQATKLNAQQTSANIVPDQAKGNLNAGDVVWAKLRCRFSFVPMSIKKEYAVCIDNFFSMFGYKCNEVKVPNITGRRNWNYVKTVGCYIEADIPQDDLQQIKDLFNKGITLWHNPATFADYSQNNDIV